MRTGGRTFFSLLLLLEVEKGQGYCNVLILEWKLRNISMM